MRSGPTTICSAIIAITVTSSAAAPIRAAPSRRSSVPEGTHDIPLGQAEVKRAGRDVTVVATSYMVVIALAAAEALAQEGIEVEVVDPRTLVPLDETAILASVRRTGRAVVVDECHLRCSPASEIAATIGEHAFDALQAPVLRVARADVPTPFSAPLEAAVTPDRDTIMRAVRRVMGRV